jgi:cbb3-type cytochrome oxidase cytochrome c subunit
LCDFLSTPLFTKQGVTSAFFHQPGMADNSFNSLLEVLRSHGVPYDQDVLKSAFDDPESQATIEAWVKEYLSPETLLTKDEATL